MFIFFTDYGKGKFPEEDDTVECDCSALPAPKSPANSVLHTQSVARNGGQLLPERNESDFVAQEESVRPAAAVTPSPDQAKQLSEVAAKLQGAGDQLIRQYGREMGVSF